MSLFQSTEISFYDRTAPTTRTLPKIKNSMLYDEAVCSSKIKGSPLKCVDWP